MEHCCTSTGQLHALTRSHQLPASKSISLKSLKNEGSTPKIDEEHHT